jgi:hypothetical protein
MRSIKETLEILGEISAATAAILCLVYQQSQRSAWAAIAAGLAALFALADGFVR